MASTIEFENYSISPIQEKDAWRLCDFVVSNSERLKTYFPKTLEQNLTPTLSELFVGAKTKAFRQGHEFLFTIKENSGRTIIGFVYIKDLAKDLNQGELAYCMSYRYEGKGIMGRAIKELVSWSFAHGLKTLQIVVHDSNLASIRVAEKNGFTWVRQLPNDHTTGSGEVLDMELYELAGLPAQTDEK
ncbi:GNAT family N-acetyltransferase [Flagellimonas flava]|uniref:Ribosomal-protein-alanine N-acetyltransferase n=1 Tax=Flagellimonas flava TaxID=570519 RepID=A0A1M5ML82_9FLAO|nr:GNAT family protein [Allomuricauda flava]SHG78006.1 ribosomal-protein-alanine N-acetyltransferase [Allomuricauda flava]